MSSVTPAVAVGQTWTPTRWDSRARPRKVTFVGEVPGQRGLETDAIGYLAVGLGGWCPHWHNGVWWHSWMPAPFWQAWVRDEQARVLDNGDAQPPTLSPLETALARVRTLAAGRARYDGQAPYDDELMLGEIERLRGLVGEGVRRTDLGAPGAAPCGCPVCQRWRLQMREAPTADTQAAAPWKETVRDILRGEGGGGAG